MSGGQERCPTLLIELSDAECPVELHKPQLVAQSIAGQALKKVNDRPRRARSGHDAEGQSRGKQYPRKT